MEELEWPDFLDEETGVFRYYGDNRQPGNGRNIQFLGLAAPGNSNISPDRDLVSF